MIRYVNLARAAAQFDAEIGAVVGAVVRSGVYVGGAEVAGFEDAFAAWCGTKHAIGVANGGEALELTLRAWGIGAGDDVVLPANTAIPTALAVTHAGANVVLADVDDESGLLDAGAVRAAWTRNTRALIVVHLYGTPVDAAPLGAIASASGAKVLEDAAHAHGARDGDARCGALGDAGAFSFYPTKNLGAFGDGGCVVTADATLAERLRLLRNLGLTQRYAHVVPGFNSRLDPLQAALLRWKLPQLDAWNARRRVLAARYCDGLRDVPGLRLPVSRANTEPVWHAFPVRIDGGLRDALADALGAAGIETNVHYRLPVHLQPCYAGRWARGDFPISERRAGELLSLPLDAFHTDDEIDAVIEALRERLAEFVTA